MRAAAFHRLSGSSRCRLTVSPDGDDLLLWLRGRYPASTLLRGSPPLTGASGTFGLAVAAACAFSLTTTDQVLKFRTEAQNESLRRLYTGRRMASR